MRCSHSVMARRTAPPLYVMASLSLPAGQATPLLSVVEAAFDDIAATVIRLVIADRSPTVTAAPLAITDLIGRFRDNGDDAALTEMAADRARGVRLVGADPIRSSPRSPGAAAPDSEMFHQYRKHRRVAGLTGPDHHDEG